MKINHVIAVLFLMVLIWGCTADTGNEPSNYSPETLTANGWTQFENGEYTLALNNFKEAVRASNTYVDAYNGAGWASARLQNLSDAANYFSQCLGLDQNYKDALAGFSFLENARKNYQNAIDYGNQLMLLDANWSFPHDANLDIYDIYLVMAESYFALEDFANSLIYVKKIDPTFNADVNTYEGKAQLADKIEQIRGNG